MLYTVTVVLFGRTHTVRTRHYILAAVIFNAAVRLGITRALDVDGRLLRFAPADLDDFDDSIEDFDVR